MPEFIADTDGKVLNMEYRDLSDIAQGYVECILFTETCSGISMVDWNDPENVEAVREGRADGSIPGDSGWGDFYPGSAETFLMECLDFQHKAGPLLAQIMPHQFPAYVVGDGTLPDSHRPAWDYDMKAVGRDFWYTRNGHGVGFWDRGFGEVGDKLTALAKTYGESYVSFGEAADGTESPTGYGFVFVE